MMGDAQTQKRLKVRAAVVAAISLSMMMEILVLKIFAKAALRPTLLPKWGQNVVWISHYNVTAKELAEVVQQTINVELRPIVGSGSV
jgi:hypothetical protein